MSVSIRMTRMGANKIAYYRIVVAPTRSKKDGAQLDTLGFYRPGANPKEAKINLDKTRDWLKKGAIPSPTTQRIIKAAEAAVKDGGDTKEVKLNFTQASTKKSHKVRLAAQKKKD